jgi:hypothetical protein
VAAAAREAYNNAMDGSHCFGIAGTASQLFGKDLPLRAIGSVFRPPYRTPWSSTMTRTIARNFAWQFVNDASQNHIDITTTILPRVANPPRRRSLHMGLRVLWLGLPPKPPRRPDHTSTVSQAHRLNS